VPPTWQFDLDAETEPSAAPVEVDEPAPVSPVAEAGTEEAEFQDNVANTSLAAKLVVRADAEESLVEQFRRLAAALHHAQLQTGARTVMIASAVEKEGKTLTATNLSLTLSQSYQRRVLLVDADLRRPSIHRSFHLDNSRGLGDVLKQKEMDGTLPVHRISPTLWVMTAGRAASDPARAVVSASSR